MRLTTNTKRVGVGLLIAAVALGACSDGKGSSRQGGQNAQREQEQVSTGFQRLSDSQQIPTFDFSQERQTVIDTETVRAEGTHGTAVATSFGGDLLWWCPTVGAPVPSTYQLSASEQYVDLPGGGHDRVPVDQGEPTGVYVGDSAATWTLCLDDNGTPFAKYEEANVGWTSGVVNGLPGDRRAQVDEITFEFTTEEDSGG